MDDDVAYGERACLAERQSRSGRAFATTGTSAQQVRRSDDGGRTT